MSNSEFLSQLNYSPYPQLGYFLGITTLLISGYITINTSYLLVLAANNLKARSYEQLCKFSVLGEEMYNLFNTIHFTFNSCWVTF